MVVGIKDGIKLVGISIVAFCAVFVCTIFLNFYSDITALADTIPDNLQALYDAQVSMAQFVCIITGGALSVIAVAMLAFYIKLFIDGNSKRFGLLRAMGYSNGRIALSFWVFGLSVFIGAAAGYGIGYAAMPYVYGQMAIDGLPEANIGFHIYSPLVLIIAPTLLFFALSCGYSALAFRKGITAMLKGEPDDGKKPVRPKKRITKARESFLTELCIGTLSNKKSTVFFVAFACFCFSSMLQMGMSMETMDANTMGWMILVIGAVLAVTSLIMAVTAVIHGNVKNIALMRAFGYTAKERAAALLLGYIPFAVLGFAIGTVYQYGLLKIIMELLFDDVAGMPEYTFNVTVFFITLTLFIALYSAAMWYFSYRISKISVKTAMHEE